METGGSDPAEKIVPRIKTLLSSRSDLELLRFDKSITTEFELGVIFLRSQIGLIQKIDFTAIKLVACTLINILLVLV